MEQLESNVRHGVRTVWNAPRKVLDEETETLADENPTKTLNEVSLRASTKRYCTFGDFRKASATTNC